jgi:DNA-directed RNA polymerase specialized sigma24 family protein
MRPDRDTEFTDYMSARMSALRRLARLLCQDWTRADDLLQVAMTKAYVHWSKAARADTTPTRTSGRSWSVSSSRNAGPAGPGGSA